MSDVRDGRTVLVAAIVSALIAGLFGLLIKTVPEGFMTRLVPYQGGVITRSSDVKVCQVVRFWVPSSNPDSNDTITKLNTAVTKVSGGWTRWSVDGEWKDSATDQVVKEGGFIYEVGIAKCDDDSVRELRQVVKRFVQKEMHQATLYFVVTRFDRGAAASP
jgi:hypothetical protein